MFSPNQMYFSRMYYRKLWKMLKQSRRFFKRSRGKTGDIVCWNPLHFVKTNSDFTVDGFGDYYDSFSSLACDILC